jgi:hypothetical protein
VEIDLSENELLLLAHHQIWLNARNGMEKFSLVSMSGVSSLFDKSFFFGSPLTFSTVENATNGNQSKPSLIYSDLGEGTGQETQGN